MAFTIITKNSERTFSDKELVNICSKDGFDFKLDVDFDCMLAVQYDLKENKKDYYLFLGDSKVCETRRMRATRAES